VRQIATGSAMGQKYNDEILASFPNLRRFWVCASCTGTAITEMIPATYVMKEREDFGHYLYLMRYEHK